MRPRPDFGEHSYRGTSRLLGKKALVTGGDSGIGRAVAVAYAREGADVLISYLSEEDDAQETARVVRDSGRMCVAVAGDISQEQHCHQLVEHALVEFGQLDILVNNAAYQMTREGIEDVSTEEWDHTLRTNLYAMFWLCRAALPKMREGGVIINTSSIQAYQPSADLLPYATTKGAIITFTKALAQEAISAASVSTLSPPDRSGHPLFRARCHPSTSRGSGKTHLSAGLVNRWSSRRSTCSSPQLNPVTSAVK
jgi:NAD(P)-dependent dehydrogenase (short-subunit alcohol dehydrogenase family)